MFTYCPSQIAGERFSLANGAKMPKETHTKAAEQAPPSAAAEFTGETDSPVEEAGFEPSVPGGWTRL
jgi:hypothetical protein